MPVAAFPGVRTVAQPVRCVPRRALTRRRRPETGCTLSEDYTISFPRLPDTAHFAYIDLGLITSHHLGVTLAQYYNINGKGHHPEIIP